MLEVSGIKVPLAVVDGTPEAERRALTDAVLHRLQLPAGELASLEPRKRSVDARRKSDVHLAYTVRVALAGGEAAEARLLRTLAHRRRDRGVRQVDEEARKALAYLGAGSHARPVVVGAGCAGLFCALTLAKAGLAPLLVERGQDATRRTADVARFNQTGALDGESNIQFGLGGAGTFSDGKLGTGTKSPLHRQILQAFVDAGAAPDILWDSKPHIGSDVLPGVVESLLARIRAAGGEARMGCRLVDLGVGSGRVASVTLSTTDAETGLVVEETIPTTCVVLACGHSARDVFELARARGVALERKTFAMGVRIEHPQALVDRAQYGPAAGHPALGAAPYKLVAHPEGARSSFTFCMCPGGYVVAAASEPGGVVTNGMSLSGRDGANANAGLLANVFPDDLPGDDVLAGVDLQRRCEREAFERGGGGFVAPAQLVGDFLAGVPSTGGGDVRPTYPRGVTWGSVEGCLPPYVVEALRAGIPEMDRRLHGFALADAVLTGVETRSSSPVRMTRGDDLQAVGTRGLWPCGEGAGYAGGIMSAATDGIRVAEAIVLSV